MKNKSYPLYDVPEFTNLKNFIDYCATEFTNRTAFHWLEKKNEKLKTYKEFKEDIEALGTYFISRGYADRVS